PAQGGRAESRNGKSVVPAHDAFRRANQQVRRLEGIGRSEVVTVFAKRPGRTGRAVKFLAQCFRQATERKLRVTTLEERHREVDIARVAVEADGMHWNRAREEREFRH